MNGAEIIIVLPMPPSGNRLTRVPRGGGRPYPSPQYVKWKRHADGFLMASEPIGGWPTIEGRFTAEIVLDSTALHGGDADNRTKALFDYAQSRRLIQNDNLNAGYEVKVGTVPEGVRMTLRPAS